MIKPFEKRLGELLQRCGPDVIPISCARKEDMERVIAEMIAAGRITEADRARCVFSREWKSPPGFYEYRLRQEAAGNWGDTWTIYRQMVREGAIRKKKRR
jgi:hypothetical protein